MEDVVVKYKGKKVNFPSSWNDLSEKQFLFITSFFKSTLINEKQNDADIHSFRLGLVKLFLNIPWWKFSQLSEEELANLLPLTDFVFSDFDLETIPLTSFRFKYKKYISKSSDYSDLSAGELALADTYFTKYVSSKEEKWLNKLSAIIFKTNKPLTDKGKIFDQIEFDKRTLLFAKLPVKYKIAALYIWWGFRDNVMISTFKNLFPKASEKKQKRVGNDYGWASTIMEIAGGKFGDFNQTNNQYWFDVFIHMSIEMDKSKAKK